MIEDKNRQLVISEFRIFRYRNPSMQIPKKILF